MRNSKTTQRYVEYSRRQIAAGVAKHAARQGVDLGIEIDAAREGLEADGVEFQKRAVARLLDATLDGRGPAECPVSRMLEAVTNVSLPEAVRFVDELERQVGYYAERRDGGAYLATEGREANASTAADEADMIVQMWRSIRPTKPAGRRGNGETIREIAHQISHGHKRSDSRAGERRVRRVLKKQGVSLAK